MSLDFREIATATMVLFAVIDIVGTIPIVVDLRQKYGHIESEKASLAAGIIMITFLFVGENVFFKYRTSAMNEYSFLLPENVPIGRTFLICLE